MKLIIENLVVLIDSEHRINGALAANREFLNVIAQQNMLKLNTARGFRIAKRILKRSIVNN